MRTLRWKYDIARRSWLNAKFWLPNVRIIGHSQAPWRHRPVIQSDRSEKGMTLHIPLMLTMDLWPNRRDPDNGDNTITGWTAEYSINGFSLGTDEWDHKPVTEELNRGQREVMWALRDVVQARCEEITREREGRASAQG